MEQLELFDLSEGYMQVPALVESAHSLCCASDDATDCAFIDSRCPEWATEVCMNKPIIWIKHAV